MATLTEDIKTFLALHHRVGSLTQEERAVYDALRERVQAALQQLPPAPEQVPAR